MPFEACVKNETRHVSGYRDPPWAGPAKLANGFQERAVAAVAVTMASGQAKTIRSPSRRSTICERVTNDRFRLAPALVSTVAIRCDDERHIQKPTWPPMGAAESRPATHG